MRGGHAPPWRGEAPVWAAANSEDAKAFDVASRCRRKLNSLNSYSRRGKHPSCTSTSDTHKG